MTIKIKIPTKHTYVTAAQSHGGNGVVFVCLYRGPAEKSASGHARPLHITCLADASHVENL